MKKYLWVTLGILVIVIVVLGAIFMQKKTPEVVSITGWKTFSDSHMTFQYPEAPANNYGSGLQEWPPTIKIVSGTFSCPPPDYTDPGGAPTGHVVKTLDGKTYCILNHSDQGAGSTYEMYEYITSYESGNLMEITFSQRWVNCDNYDEPQRSACKSPEVNTFDPDQVIPQIVASFKELP